MATITFSNGKKVNFDGNPTPEDVDFVAKQIGISSNQPEQTQTEQNKPFMERASNTLGGIFGGKVIGNAIGTYAAKEINRIKGREELNQYIDKGPSALQVAGDVGRVALNFAPFGRIAKGLQVGGEAIGIGSKLAKPIANIATGAGIGYAGDVTTKLSEGQNAPFKAGLGTGIGAGISTLPYVGKGLGKLGTEILGVTTGTGAGTVRQFGSAIQQGGEAAQAARGALRGKIAPQEIVDEAKGAFGTLLKNRADEYGKQLEKLKPKGNQIDHVPIIDRFNKKLQEFGVTVNENGTPNFTRAPGLGRYETDLRNMSKVLQEWGTQQGDNTILGVDKLKQVIDDFRIGSNDSKKFDAFVTDLRNEAKNLIRNSLKKSKDLKTLGTYEKMLGDYEKSTREIRDIRSALSLGDKASVDTAFRKISSVLRTNNEIRQKAVQELDDLTGGTLIPKIAGQQMSEVLPRGVIRPIGAVAGAGGLATGVGIVPLLKIALISSPRVVGEILNVLGIIGNNANKVKNVLKQLGQQSALIGAGQ